MLRKGLLAAITVFPYSLGGNVQALLAQVVLMTFLAAQLMARPFVTDGPNLNLMELVSLACSTLGFAVGLLFNDPNVNAKGRHTVSIVFIFILAATFLYLARALLVEALKDFDTLLSRQSPQLSEQASLISKLCVLLRYWGALAVAHLKALSLATSEVMKKLRRCCKPSEVEEEGQVELT